MGGYNWFKRRTMNNKVRRDENKLRAEYILLDEDWEIYKAELAIKD
jgi:hypothetical protein